MSLAENLKSQRTQKKTTSHRNYQINLCCMLRKKKRRNTEDNDSIKIGNSFTVEVLQCIMLLMKY